MVRKNSELQTQWVSKLSQKELPAITSVANILQEFSNDDTSSIPKLSNALLYDQGLSSRILRVANSAFYMHKSKITTVSRASTVLGISSVKNICLTSKVLDGLLKSKNLDPAIYAYLAKKMADAFHAGLLAKMMLPNHNDELQEEVYLAALMRHIGETTFWSTNSELAKRLILDVKMENAKFKSHCFKLTGLDFDQLTVSLAEKWNLGTLLLKSVDEPESRSIELQTISYANKLSEIISSPNNTSENLNLLLKNISKNMNITTEELKVKIAETGILAKNLLSSYGAADLIKHINAMSNNVELVNDSEYNNEASEKVIKESNDGNEKKLLDIVKALSKQCFKSKNINDYLHIALKDLSLIYQFDFCIFWLYQEKKQIVLAKSSVSRGIHSKPEVEAVHLNGSNNIISEMFRQNAPLLIKRLHDEKWQKLMSLEINKLVQEGSICLAPVTIGNKQIGFISGQRFDSKKTITDKEFSEFTFIIEHFNMCLNMVFQQ